MKVKLEHHPDYLHIYISGTYQGIFPKELQPGNLAKVCRDGSCNRMLVDARDFSGTLGTIKRFEVAAELAQTSPVNRARIAVVEDTNRAGQVSFFETVAINRGINLRVFTDFDEATEWLTTQSIGTT